MIEIEINKIGSMMNYLNNCEIKGLKFKKQQTKNNKQTCQTIRK
jgi:hypothetical protein